MNVRDLDKIVIKSMDEAKVRSELYIALTMIRKTVTDVPEKDRRASTSYTSKGHANCVNYLRGFLNIWEKKHGL